MRAQIALDEKDTARARELCDAARAETGRGTPPPQFMVMLNAVDAMVTAAESGPGHGLPKLADTVREAVEQRCADVIMAALVDGAAGLLADLGDLPRAVRLLAAAEHWRGGDPRPMPERARGRASGGRRPRRPGRRTVRGGDARGAALTPDDVLDELAEACAATRPGGPVATRSPAAAVTRHVNFDSAQSASTRESKRLSAARRPAVRSCAR